MTLTPIARSLDPNPGYRVTPTRVFDDGTWELDGAAYASLLETAAYFAAKPKDRK